LQEYRLAIGDRAAEHIPTHITLLPPLEIGVTQLEQALAHLDLAAKGAEPIGVQLRGTGTFRPVSPVVFVNVVAGISQMEGLARQIQRGPLSVDTKFPYHPHVTVAQDVDESRLDQAFAELADFAARFVADEFWLYLHDDEMGWQPERSFALG